jgi:5-methylcytosine-specific restriction protein A
VKRRPMNRIRQLRPGEDVPEGNPRRYKSDSRGYIRLRWQTGLYEYVETYEHRLVAGVPVGDVHHVNEKKDDNAEVNLRVMSRSEHSAEHGAERTRTSRSMNEWDGARSQLAYDKREAAKRRRTRRAADVDRIGQLYSEGKTTTEIGHLLNLHSSTVSRTVRVAGVVPRKGRRNTNISPDVRQIVQARARMKCERCGKNLTWGGGQVHHRRPRRMGGSRDPITNTPANLMFLCLDCHEWIERNREESIRRGWIVPSWNDPAKVPWGPA